MTRQNAPIWLQIVVIALVAMLPVVWLVGRRTTPPPGPLPMLVSVQRPAIILQEGLRGIAGGIPPVNLPELEEHSDGYRLNIILLSPGEEPVSPYHFRVDGPTGDSLWQGVREIESAGEGQLQLILPAEHLQPGRYALVVEDGEGTVRNYPFLVP